MTTFDGVMERGFFKIAKVRGAPIRLHWSLPLGAFAFGGFALAPAFWVGFVTLVLAHELGHALIAWRFGHHVHAIDITALGGRCIWQSGDATSYERGAVSWGGVLAQAFILGVALLAVSASRPLESVVALQLSRAFVTVNLILIAVNLLPLSPLDGAEAWPWLAARWRARKQLGERRRISLIEGTVPSIAPPPTTTARMVAAPVVRAPKAPAGATKAGSGTPDRIEPIEVPEPREAYRSDEAFTELLKRIAEESAP